MFAGSVPETYDRLLVPLIFESYAADLATRPALLDVASVIEVAAGTGVVTRALASSLASGEARSRAATCEIPAIAYCQGTPLRNEIEQRGPTRLRRRHLGSRPRRSPTGSGRQTSTV